MLEALDLHFAHRGAPPLLRGVSLSVRPGDLVCLLGANGSGKTTLLRLLLGLERPSAGTLRFDGEDLPAMSPARRARRLAYVPQATVAGFPFRADDVVLMGRASHLRLLADPDAADHRAAAQAMERVGVGPLAQRRFDELSGGERQLVLIARALAQQARVLLLDEPTAGLDLGHQVQVLQVLRSLAAEGQAVLMSTHEPAHALWLDAQAALLANGRLQGPGPAARSLDAATLGRLYGTPLAVQRLVQGPAAGQAVCVPVLPWNLEGPDATTPSPRGQPAALHDRG